MKYSLILFFFIVSKCLLSQNLIADPGFENTGKYTIKELYARSDKYYHWIKIIPWLKNHPSSGFGDYLEFSRYLELNKAKYEPGEIERIRSWWRPHRGNSLFFPSFTFFTNLYQSRLTKPLEKDSIYYFQMYIKVMGNKYGKSDLIKGKLGLWFTNHLFTDSAGQMIMHKNKLKITPHIQVKDFVIKENFKWLKYTTTFKSDGQYEYVIIGNFQPLMSQTAEMWTKKEGLTYRLDDMCLVPIRLKEYCSYTDSGEIFDLKNVYFDVNKYDLNKEGIKVLTDLALNLKDLNITLELTGYADSTGNEMENKDLSQNRAKEVYNFLLKEGMEASKITYKGEGSAKPIDTNDTEDGRKLNRRVEIKINIK